MRDVRYLTRVMDQARNPEHLGHMDTADAEATFTGWCGDTMEVYLRLNGRTIQEATFMTDGCESALACGNLLMTMVHGMSLKEANQIEPEDLIQALEDLPEDTTHCAELAVNTLRRAIAQHTQK